MAITVERLPFEDLERLPREREGDRHELIDGVLYVTASPIPLHQIVTVNFATIVAPYVRANRLRQLFVAPIDVFLSPIDYVVPDLVYVVRDRFAIVGEKRIEGSPDLVGEILAPSTRDLDLTVKKDLYERFGVKEYWVLDPIGRTVTVWTLDRDRFVELPVIGGIAESKVIPNLAITVAELFEM